MLETGTIIEIKDGGQAVIRFERKSSCGKCNLCMGKKDAHIDYTVENADGAKEAKVGDRALADLNAAALTLSALIVYVMPLIFAAVAFLATRGLDERIRFGAALGAIVLSFAAAALLDAKCFRRKRLRLKIVKVIPKEELIQDGGEKLSIQEEINHV